MYVVCGHVSSPAGIHVMNETGITFKVLVHRLGVLVPQCLVQHDIARGGGGSQRLSVPRRAV